MPYTKQTWTDSPSTTTPISAARLTVMENGIGAAAELVASEGVKVHDGTASGGTRPTGYVRVRWVSPDGATHTRPTNMANGDLWERDA